MAKEVTLHVLVTAFDWDNYGKFAGVNAAKQFFAKYRAKRARQPGVTMYPGKWRRTRTGNWSFVILDDHGYGKNCIVARIKR